MSSGYRALGADPPFGDPRRGHGVGMEGYFWRLSDRDSGRVVVALAGICRPAARVDEPVSWAGLALAAHPGGYLRGVDVRPATAVTDRFGVIAGTGSDGRPTFEADPDRLRVRLAEDARLEVAFQQAARFPARGLRGLGALGPAHLIPGLDQYWHPHLLGARVRGEAVIDGERISLDGWDAYAEKNWGRGGFPRRWWWGQAQGFERRDVCVAFAGGELSAGPLTLRPTGIVVRLGDELVRLGNPLLAPAEVSVDPASWTVRSRGPLWSVAIHGRAVAGQEHVLPVPDLALGRTLSGAHEHLAGSVELVVRRRGRVVFAGASALAGLEYGERP